MKTLAAITFAAVTAFSLTACEDMYGHHDDHHDRIAQAGFVDGYYDDFYGPFDAGYWGDDGVFVYRGSDRQFHRDDGGHFRRDGATGFHTMHGPEARPDGAGRGMDHG